MDGNIDLEDFLPEHELTSRLMKIINEDKYDSMSAAMALGVLDVCKAHVTHDMMKIWDGMNDDDKEGEEWKDGK